MISDTASRVSGERGFLAVPRRRSSHGTASRCWSRGILCPRRASRIPCASRSETVSRGAGCVNRARPDLWGPGAGDRPRLPDWEVDQDA